MKNIAIVNTFLRSVEEIEGASSSFEIFNMAIHKFLLKLIDEYVVKDFSVTYNDHDSLFFMVRFTCNAKFEGLYSYDKELYHGSSKQS